MIHLCFELRRMMLMVLATALLAFVIIDPSLRNAEAAEAKKADWQAEWEKVLAAAKNFLPMS